MLNTGCLVKLDRSTRSIAPKVEYKICFILSMSHKLTLEDVHFSEVHRHASYSTMQNDTR
jgi:hypothetical protein